MRFQTIAGVVVLIIICMGAMSLLLPGLDGHRGGSRQMQCANNMKQLCLGLQNYHDTHLYLPPGAENRPMDEEFKKVSWGKSWLVATLPFCDNREVYERLEKAEKTRAGSCFTSEEVRAVVNERRMKIFICPASPLPEWQTLTGSKMTVPSYAGIMGATNEPGPPGQNLVDDARRIVSGPYGGQAAANGMLPINESLPFAACVDGTANTIIVGEVSDWYYDDTGAKRNPALSIGDAGDGAFDEAGWTAGNNLRFVERPLGKDPMLPKLVGLFVYKGGPAILNNSVCNLITIDHPTGSNNQSGKSDEHPNWGTKGIGRCGFNNPLSSAHPAGAMAGFLDGHVQLLTNQTSMVILKRLANRDNDGVTGE